MKYLNAFLIFLFFFAPGPSITDQFKDLDRLTHQNICPLSLTANTIIGRSTSVEFEPQLDWPFAKLGFISTGFAKAFKIKGLKGHFTLAIPILSFFVNALSIRGPPALA